MKKRDGKGLANSWGSRKLRVGTRLKNGDIQNSSRHLRIDSSVLLSAVASSVRSAASMTQHIRGARIYYRQQNLLIPVLTNLIVSASSHFAACKLGDGG